ncbi:MAG TPA: DUF4382 domain-containing protein [Longimicrobiales bacterium]|nr:DUF4382 domain-containing protein [Longimicrobiales bacterium]
MRSTRLMAVLLAAAGTLAACDSDSSPSGVNQGRLTIQLTDAPGDLAEAWVRIDEIVLFEAGAGENSSGRIELNPDYGDYINLLTLAGGQVMDLVDSAIVPPGTYNDLRFIINDAYVRLNDGRVFATSGATLPTGTTADGTLRCPSCAQSGFKIRFQNGDLRVEDNAVVLVDFDVAQSFGHEAGKSGQWIMRPVLRATTQTIQLASIAGGVALADGVTVPACGGEDGSLAHFQPTTMAGDDTISASMNADGTFRFSHLMPGTYSLGYAQEITFTNGDVLSFTAEATPGSVTVAAGENATADYEITAAVCETSG